MTKKKISKKCQKRQKKKIQNKKPKQQSLQYKKKKSKNTIVLFEEAKPKFVTFKPPIKENNKNQYFTKIHENAILEYASIIDNNKKSYLYTTFIQPAFNEMVEKIVYTYKFNSLPNIEDLKSECKIFLTTILDKYDVNRGSKAFSYFSVITKNWFIHKVKKNNNKKEIYIEDIKDTSSEEELIYEETYLFTREKEEFWVALENEMYSWLDKRLKENEIKIYKAILLLFKESENIEIFNKKAIYLYMREITGLNTKQVVNNLKKFRNKYNEFQKNWNNGNISHVKSRTYINEQ